MRRINLLILFALATALAICTYGQEWRSESQTKPPKGKILVERLPEGVEGVELKDGMVRLKSGYKFVKGKGNTVSVARIRGGGDLNARGTWSCHCSDDSGGCSIFQTPSSLYCETGGCTGACELKTTTNEGVVAIMRYAGR